MESAETFQIQGACFFAQVCIRKALAATTTSEAFESSPGNLLLQGSKRTKRLCHRKFLFQVDMIVLVFFNEEFFVFVRPLCRALGLGLLAFFAQTGT